MKPARRGLRIALSATAVTIGAFALALAWFVSSDDALRWVTGRLVAGSDGRLVIEGAEGALRSPMRAKRISYVSADLRVTATDVELAWLPRSLLARELHVTRIAAAKIVVESPATASAGKAPASLALPIPVTIDRVAVANLELRAGPNVLLLGALEFGYAGDASHHALSALGARTEWGLVEGALTIGAQAPLPVSGTVALAGSARLYDARIAARMDGNLSALRLMLEADADGARLNASAVLTPFEAVLWRDLHAQADALDLSRVAANLPSTRLAIALDAAPAAGGTIRGSIAVDNSLPGAVDAHRVPVDRVSATFAATDDRLNLTEVDARVGRTGRVTGSGTLTRAGSQWQVTIAGLDLRDIVSSLHRTSLGGSAQGEVRDDVQRWQGEVRDRRLALAFAADAQGSDIALRRFRLVAGAGSFEGSARLALAGDRRFAVDATAARVDPAYFGDYPSGVLSGTITARGTLVPTWSVDAKVALAEGSRVRGTPLAGTAAMLVTPERVSGVVLQLASGNNHLTALGAFGQTGDVLQYTLDAGDLAALATIVPGYPIGGRLSVSGNISGSRSRPAVAFHGIGDGLHWGSTYRVGHVDADGVIDLASASDTPWRVNANARTLALGKSAFDRLTLRVDGTRARHDAEFALHGGDLDLRARLAGEFSGDAGHGQWRGQVASLVNGGRYPLTLAAPAELAWDGSRLTLADAHGSLVGGTFTLRDLTWEVGHLSSSGEFSALPIAPVLALGGIDQRVSSTLTVDGRWAFSAAPHLDGSLSIVRSGGDVAPTGAPDLALQISRLDVQARSVDDHVDVSASVRSRFGELEAHGKFVAAPHGGEFVARDAPLSLALRVDAVSLRPLQSLLGTNAVIDGRMHADLSGSGTIDQVQLSGNIDADDMRITAPQFGLALRDGVVRAQLAGGGLILERLSFKAGDGSFEASGTLPRYEGVATQASLHWTADRLRLLDRPDARLVLSGRGDFVFADKRLRLEGELVSDEGYFEFRPSRPGTLGDDVVVRGRERREPKSAAPKVPFAVDLALDFGNRFNFVGNGLDVALSGRIRVMTDGVQPLTAKGTIDATRGSYTVFGQRLDIARGRLIFDGSLDDPAIDLLALRKNLAVEAGVAVTGTVRVPHVQLTSNPPVPDSEKLSWLVLGRGVATGGADQAALQLAMATLSGAGPSLSQRFARSVGVDDISVRSADATRTGAASQIVAVSKRLTDRISLVYEQGLSLANNAIKLEYALTPTITLRAEAGVVSGFGIYYSRSFD